MLKKKKKRKKETSKLAKSIIWGGLVLKGLILPIKGHCPSVEKDYTALQQNLKNSEYILNYGKGENVLSYSGPTYYLKFF